MVTVALYTALVSVVIVSEQVPCLKRSLGQQSSAGKGKVLTEHLPQAIQLALNSVPQMEHDEGLHLVQKYALRVRGTMCMGHSTLKT